MSGQLVGTLIGYYFGGPVGGFIGGMIGGALDPQDGPGLSDLRPQSSEYGRPIPIVYGTIAVGGNVIWASDLIKTSDGGGKGGSSSTGPTYAANFAVAICEGVRTLGRIWAGPDKRLIWDGATLEGADAGAVMRFYSGTEDQLPDPLMESYLGVGNVPGYRGTAYLVLENFPVEKDGNRIPFLFVEVGADSSAAPANLGIFFVQQTIMIDAEHYAVIFNGSYFGIIIRRFDDQTLYAEYVYPLAEWNVLDLFFYDADRQLFVQPDGLGYITISLVDGTRTVHPITAAGGADPDIGAAIHGSVYHNGSYIFAATGSAAASRITLYLVDPDTGTCTATYAATPGSGVFSGPLMAPIDHVSPYVFAVSSGGVLTRLGLASGATPADMGALATGATEVRQDPNTGKIWSIGVSGGILSIAVNDPATLTNVYAADLDFPAGLRRGSAFCFVPGSPNKVIVFGEQFLALDYFMVLDADTPAVLEAGLSGGYHGTAVMYGLDYNPVTRGLMAFRDGGWATFGTTADPTTVNYLVPGTTIPEPDNKYLGEQDGTVQPRGELLSDIVLDLSERAGLISAQVDVTQLANDMVDGYAIASQTSVRDAIMTLMPAYYFDGVESGVAKFVKRGGAIAVAIPDEDLGAYEDGAEPVDPLETTRIMDEELARILDVKYLLAASKYDQATRIAKRLIGNSGDEQTLELPLVLTDTKAQEVAEVNLHAPWVERLTHNFSLPRKYAYLEPTDIVVVQGHTVRLKKVKQSGGVYHCEAVRDDSQVYIPVVVVTETPPPPSGSVPTVTDTILELM